MSKPGPGASGPADAVTGSWVESAPRTLQPYLRLSRFDRPIGFWLLGLPCLAGLIFARLHTGLTPIDAWYSALFMVGAVAMRGAGCTYNDILDKDIDAEVERTARRPIPAGVVSARQAWAWLIGQCVVGLLVLLMLPLPAQIVGLASIPLVALYPIMKRITWWPQAWLGLTMNWGVLVGAATARGTITPEDIALYFALGFWTIGYDTIYAAQDREDDALVGVRSTARLFGSRIQSGVWIFYILTIAASAVAFALSEDLLALGLIAPFGLHLLFQAVRFTPDNNPLSLRLFRSNRDAAILLVVGLSIAATLP